MKNASYKLGLALALSVFAVDAASAQQGQRQQGQRQGQRQQGQQQGEFRRGGRGFGFGGGALLKGITLTDAQKTRLETLRAEQRKEFEKNRPQGQANGQRAERTRPDSATIAARRAEMTQRREQQIASIRSILTADQRVQFDKNVAELKANDGKRGEGRGGEGHKGHGR